MPEGHTLHRLARTLNRRFGAQVIASSSPQGRFSAGAERVDGLVLRRAEAWGKHLFVRFDGLEERVHVHLGLYGKVGLVRLDEDGQADPPVGQVRWRLIGDDSVADLRGPTACELLTPDEFAAVLDRLGPDPLRTDADPERAWRRISRSRASIAVLLMDQSVVAGIGNVYRAEVLFRHGLDPHMPGRAIDRLTWEALWDDLVHLLKIGVRRGRIDTVRPEHEELLPRRRGRAERANYVYRRNGLPCRVCGTEISHQVVAGRNLFWCPGCQPAVTVRE